MPDALSPSRTNESLIAEVDSAVIAQGDVALWYTGGAGYILKTSTTTLYIDPFCGPSLDEKWQRALPVPFDPNSVVRCDAILSTHEHADHCDPYVLRPMLKNTTAPFAGPATSVESASGMGWPSHRLKVLSWGDSWTLGDIILTTVRSHDPMAKGCNGYVLQIREGATIVNMGDTLWYDTIGAELRRWRIDVLCLSVAHNPPDETLYMSEVDAVRIARDARAQVLMPHHWDLWKGVALDPRRVQAAAPWYCPDTRVVPARFCRRVTVSRAGDETVVSFDRP